MTSTPNLVVAATLLLGTLGAACSDDDDRADSPPVTIDTEARCNEAVESNSSYEPTLHGVDTITAGQASDLHNELDPTTHNPWVVRDEYEPVAKCLMEFAVDVDNYPGQRMWFILMADNGPIEPLPAPRSSRVI